MPTDTEVVTDHAYELVIITMPNGEELYTRRWLATGAIEVDYRQERRWTPIALMGGSFRIEQVA